MLEQTLAHELRLAILTSQLQIAVQPKVNLATLETIGGEVLLRWHHPKHGFIPADRWVTIAESHELMPQLNRWILGQVISLLKRKPQIGPLAINVSPSSVDIHFLQFVLSELANNKVDPRLLEIEITESTTVPNLNTLAHCIRQFRKYGIIVSLDDFGSGYSSMQYLVELEVDKIKIDRSFIQKAKGSSNANLILKKLIDLGKEIDLRILCEGIETEEQLNLVKSLGADEAQGFYFGKPELVEESLTAAHNTQSSYLKAS